MSLLNLLFIIDRYLLLKLAKLQLRDIQCLRLTDEIIGKDILAQRTKSEILSRQNAIDDELFVPNGMLTSSFNDLGFEYLPIIFDPCIGILFGEDASV